MIKNENIINVIKKEYSLDVTSIKCLQDGADNFVFKIATPNKDFVFRISKRQKQPQDIEFETSLACFLSKTTLPVAKVISTQAGAPFCIFDNKVSVLFDFCLGDTFALSPQNKPSKKMAYNGGKILAKLHKELQIFHQQYRNYGSRKLTSEFSRVIENKKEFQKKYIDAQNFLSQISDVLQKTSAAEMNTIVHNDFRIQNILIHKDDICAILDFDWACEGNNLKDLAHALVEWSYPDGAKGYWEDIFYSFLDGYESEYGKIDRAQLKEWISFACLSDTCTYLMDLLEEISEPMEIKSYMYRKYLFFKAQDIK